MSVDEFKLKLRRLCSSDSEESELGKFIVESLSRKSGGDGARFTALLETLETPTEGDGQVRLVLCLARSTAMLQRKAHSNLITSVLSGCWLGNPALLSATESFANNCVSANAELLHPILGCLVRKFTDFPAPTMFWTSATGEQDEVGKSADLHKMLCSILSTFPTGTGCLVQLLRDGFPHRRRPVEDQRRSNWTR